MNLQNLTIDEFEALVREMGPDEKRRQRNRLSPKKQEQWDAMMQRVNDRLDGEIRALERTVRLLEQ
jgi:hypothetical protein